MQTKLVLTTLSLAMLFSSSAFSMMPRTGGALLSRLAQQTLRKRTPFGLPSNGVSRRFLSDKVATPSTDTWRKDTIKGVSWTLGAVLAGGVGLSYAIDTIERKEMGQIAKKEELENRERIAEREEKERIATMRSQLPSSVVEDIEKDLHQVHGRDLWEAWMMRDDMSTQDRWEKLVNDEVKREISKRKTMLIKGVSEHRVNTENN